MAIKTERLYMRLTAAQKEDLEKRAAVYNLSLSKYLELYLFEPDALCLEIKEVNIL